MGFADNGKGAKSTSMGKWKWVSLEDADDIDMMFASELETGRIKTLHSEWKQKQAEKSLPLYRKIQAADPCDKLAEKIRQLESFLRKT